MLVFGDCGIHIASLPNQLMRCLDFLMTNCRYAGMQHSSRSFDEQLHDDCDFQGFPEVRVRSSQFIAQVPPLGVHVSAV